MIFLLGLFFIIPLIMHLNLAEEKIRKCLVHFCVIRGVSVTSVWAEFLLDSLQTIELFFSVLCNMIVICLLLPAPTISWTRWWAKKMLSTSKTDVLSQCYVLAIFWKNWSPAPAASSRKRRREWKEIQMQIEIQICTEYLYLYLCISCVYLYLYLCMSCLSVCICICISGKSVYSHRC